MKKFVSATDYKNYPRVEVLEITAKTPPRIYSNINELFDSLAIYDDITISYHHHLRNGDSVVNLIIDKFASDYTNTLNIAASSIFEAHSSINKLIMQKRINNIHTNYINGSVAKEVSNGNLNGHIYMHTHGGRARAIESGEIEIDIAFIAVSEIDKLGNCNGLNGKSAFGSIGYAYADASYAKIVVAVTDNVVEKVSDIHIDGKYVDYILVVDSIGNPGGIVSGTTKITTNPVGLKIARDSSKIIDELGFIKDGISMQTGAGGTSLAVANEIKNMMSSRSIIGKFASGGITNYFVSMLENKLLESLYDVQCFDLAAVHSIKNNSNHFVMSASKYANPYDNPIVNQLDLVVLGATEVDLNFNVNVITDSNNNLIGGSGGHSDTAYGAKLTIITSPLIKGRLPLIKNRVTTITTPGETVDIIVTERGIAINPLRQDLINMLSNTKLNIMSIEDLQQIAYEMCGVPNEISLSNQVIGYVIYRDGSVIDTLYKNNV